MQVFIICHRKEDGTWEGKVKIDLKQEWYLEVNRRLAYDGRIFRREFEDSFKAMDGIQSSEFSGADCR